MRRRSSIALVGAVTLALALTAPAQAADFPDAYASAVERSATPSDIPKALGSFTKDPSLFFGAPRGALMVCPGPTTVPEGITIAGGKYRWSTSFIPVKEDEGPFVEVTVYQYAKATDAIKAFRQLERRINQCVTSNSDTWTDPDTGQTTTWTSQTTVGKVPLVTIVGVESRFVNTNRTSSSTTDVDAPNSSDVYSVFSLIDDAIIVTSADSGSFNDFGTKQKRAVNRLAFAATGNWVG